MKDRIHAYDVERWISYVDDSLIYSPWMLASSLNYDPSIVFSRRYKAAISFLHISFGIHKRILTLND